MNVSVFRLELFFPVVALFARVFFPASAGLSYALLAVYAFYGRAQAIQALGLSWLFTMLNPGIAGESSAISVGRYFVIATASCSVMLRSGFIRSSLAVSKLVLWTILLGISFIAHSLFFSLIVDVSVFKAISWTIVAATIFSAWGGLTSEERERLGRQVFGGLAVIMIASIPLAGNATGYLRNGSGFQGVLNHPQAFGPTMALLAAWAGSVVLILKRPHWALTICFWASSVLVIMSEARTAGLAVLLGVLLAVFVAPVLTKRSIISMLPGLRNYRIHLMVVFGLVLVLASGTAFTGRIEQYLVKRSDASSLVDAYEASRGKLIDRMVGNIIDHPWAGIGFGIGSFPENMEIERDSIFGLPVSAAVEKGVLPIAVVEEVGLLGFLGVLLWLSMLIMRAARGSGFAALSVLLVVLLLNFGEAVLFSPGGLGMLSLIIIGWAVTGRPESSRKIPLE